MKYTNATTPRAATSITTTNDVAPVWIAPLLSLLPPLPLSPDESDVDEPLLSSSGLGTTVTLALADYCTVVLLFKSVVVSFNFLVAYANLLEDLSDIILS